MDAAAHTADSLLANAQWMRRLALGLARDESEADDLVQDAWVAALSAERRGGRPWLARVLRNVARQRGRSESARRGRERRAARPEATASTGDVVARAALQEELARAVLRLREPVRTTVLLRYLDGRTSAEIARAEDVPESTVRNRLRRGLEELRRDLDGRRPGGWRDACAVLLGAPIGEVETAAGVAGGGWVMAGAAKWALVTVACLGAVWLGWRGLAAPSGTQARAVPVHDAAEEERVAIAQPAVLVAPPDTGSGEMRRDTLGVAGRAEVQAPAAARTEETFAVFGTVRDQGTRRVLGRGRMRLERSDSDDRLSGLSREGDFRVAGLGFGTWTLRADVPGYLLHEEPIDVRTAGDVRRDIELVPAPTIAVHATTYDGRGLPAQLEDPRNVFALSSLAAVATTDAPVGDLPSTALRSRGSDGIGEFRTPEGEWPVRGESDRASLVGTLELRRATPPCYVSLILRHVVIATEYVPLGAERVDFVVPVEAFAAHLATIRMEVRDRTTGAPVERGFLMIGHAQMTHQRPVIFRGGVLEFAGFAPGDYKLELCIAGYERVCREVRLAPGEVHDLGLFELGKPLEISGRIVLPNGRGTRARLHLTSTEDGEVSTLLRARPDYVSSPDGTFRIRDLGHGRHVLHIEPEDHGAAPVELSTESGSLTDIEIRLEPTVTLRVTNPGAETVSVRLETRNGLEVWSARTRASATVEARVVPGTYRLIQRTAGRTIERELVVLPLDEQHVTL